jgi:hypothetical protein
VRTPVLLADFVRRADRRGTSERSLGEGRYWRVEESRRTANFCQEYFLKIRNFHPGLGRGLRLIFALSLWVFAGFSKPALPLVARFASCHNPPGRISCSTLREMCRICQLPAEGDLSEFANRCRCPCRLQGVKPVWCSCLAPESPEDSLGSQSGSGFKPEPYSRKTTDQSGA